MKFPDTPNFTGFFTLQLTLALVALAPFLVAMLLLLMRPAARSGG